MANGDLALVVGRHGVVGNRECAMYLDFVSAYIVPSARKDIKDPKFGYEKITLEIVHFR